jgi:hypothetical protein
MKNGRCNNFIVYLVNGISLVSCPLVVFSITGGQPSDSGTKTLVNWDERSYKNRQYKWEMDGTNLVLCPVAVFGFTGVKTWVLPAEN